MKGLRVAAWGAAGTVIAGLAAVALIAALVYGPRAPEAVGGATYASIAGGRDARLPAARLVVTSLRTGGSESAAGLRVGDAVAAVDGIADPSLATLRRELNRRTTHAGPVALIVERGGDAIPLTLLQAPRETRFDEDPAGRGR